MIGILTLGAAILATTFLGASRAVRSINRALIDRAVEQSEAEVLRFFEPLGRSLFSARAWGEEGLLDPERPELVDLLFRPLLRQMPQLAAVTVAWESGQIHRVAPLEGEARLAVESRSIEDQDWFVEAIERVENPWPMYLSPVRRGAELDALDSTASMAWVGPDGRGVIMLEIAFEEVIDFAQGLRVTEGGGVTLMTEDFQLLAMPEDPRYWMGVPRGWLLKTPNELGSSLVERAVEAYSVQSEAQQGEPVRFRHEGAVWWSQVRRVDLGPEGGLLVSVLVPNADLVGDRVQTRWWILGLTLFVLGIAIVRAWLMARRLSQPIEALVRNSERMSAGDLDRGEEVHAPFAEVEALVAAQTEMRRSLRSLVKMESDIDVAREIQQSTLPTRLPQVDGFDLAAWSEPAEETGGDAYDAFGLSAAATSLEKPRRAMLLLADASGHGIGPALSVTQLRAMLRMAARMGGELSRTARLLNDQLWADLPRGRFITCWLGEIDSASGSLRSLSAGQGPLIYYDAARDRVEQYPADAPPFGVLEHLELPEPKVKRMAPGDVMAVVSDGIYEAKDSRGRELGRDNVASVVATHASEPAERIGEAVRELVNNFTGGAPADDDRTVLLIRRS